MNDSTWRERYEQLERERLQQDEVNAALENVLRRFVLRLTLAARGLGPKLDVVLDQTNQAMRNNMGTDQLEPLLGELSNAVASTEAPAVSVARGTAEAAISDEVRAALTAILDRIELDPSLLDRGNEVRARIAAANAVQPLATACTDLADLLAAQRERARLEKADVQRILLQVDSRLHEFVSYLRGEAAERKAASDSQQELDHQMRGEVLGLTQSVQSATDLIGLQTQVRSTLASIDQHLLHFRNREAKRIEAYKERAERMRSRVEQLESETLSLQASLAREHANATTDPLTGVPNRLAYNQRVALEYKRWKRFGRPLCVAAWDIDHFKDINDTYGHPAGDQVIRNFAKVLASHVRETDFMARHGGEEFVLLLVDTPIEAALKALEKYREAIQRTGVSIAGKMIRITASAGVAEFTGDDEPEAVFERADQALYRAKRGGRNRCERA